MVSKLRFGQGIAPPGLFSIEVIGVNPDPRVSTLGKVVSLLWSFLVAASGFFQQYPEHQATNSLDGYGLYSELAPL